MKPGDLRRHAYTFEAWSDAAWRRGETHTKAGDRELAAFARRLSLSAQRYARALSDRADELEARHAQ